MNEHPPSGRLSAADVVTIANAALGFLAIALLARRWASDPAEIADGIQQPELKLAGALIAAGALCDVADGIVARATRRSGFGDVLDVIADIVTFGVAPAFLIAVAGFALPSPLDGFALAAATLYVVAVVVRLARHASTSHAPADGFHGVTSPAGALAAIAIVALELPGVVTIAAVLAVSASMVAPFAYPHQTRPAMMAVVLTFVGIAVAVLLDLMPLRVASALGLCTIVLLPIVHRGAASFRLAKP